VVKGSSGVMPPDWVLAIVAALALVGAVMSQDMGSQKARAPPVEYVGTPYSE